MLTVFVLWVYPPIWYGLGIVCSATVMGYLCCAYQPILWYECVIVCSVTAWVCHVVGFIVCLSGGIGCAIVPVS